MKFAKHEDVFHLPVEQLFYLLLSSEAALSVFHFNQTLDPSQLPYIVYIRVRH